MQHHPQHLACILDGNRRWATKQGVDNIQGYRQGINNVHSILKHCKRRGITTVSLYGFSTENWNRSQQEVSDLMDLFALLLVEERHKLIEHQVKIRFVGDLARFDQRMREAMQEIEEETNKYSKYTIFICLSYGGRLELVHGAKKLAQAGEAFTEENLEKHLWTHDMSDVDLVIRTGGNRRLSNFLLWRIAYAELYFTDTLWPDFTPQELDAILEVYHKQVQINKGV